MASKVDSDSDDQAPDNSRVETLDTSGFEVTADRMEQLIKNMEVMLSDVEELRSHCSHQAKELLRASADLRQQQEEVKEGYSQLAREMQEIIDSLDQFNTTSAFEEKEKETQKLNQQL